MGLIPHERVQPVSPRTLKKARRWKRAGGGCVDDDALLNAEANEESEQQRWQSLDKLGDVLHNRQTFWVSWRSSTS